MRYQNSSAFSVLGQITEFLIPDCRVRFSVAWSITYQYYPAGHTRGDGFLVAEVEFLMVTTWFSMSSCPWIRRAHVLYLCTCGTARPPSEFWYAGGGIGSVSSGIMWGA